MDLSKEEVGYLRRSYLAEKRISEILRSLLREHSDFGPGQLIAALMETFCVKHESLTCIGNWWPDDETGFTDDEIDRRVAPEIQACREKWEEKPV